MSSAQEHSGVGLSAPRAKKRRLNFACNYCRNRKTRCDEQQPSCRACLVAGVPCITVNLRRPGSLVKRRETGEKADLLFDRTPPLDAPNSDPPAASTPRTVPSTIHQPRHDSQESDHSPRFQGPLSLLRQRHAQSTIETLAAWLDLAIHRLGRPRTSFSTTIRGSESPRRIFLCLSGPPPLPDRKTCDTLLSSYFETVNLVYPLLEVVRTREISAFTHEYGPEKVCERYGVASLMQVYLVISLGAYSCPNVLPPLTLSDIQNYCKTLHGHIVCRGDLDTVRATALASLSFKFQGNDAGAWATLAQSSSLADSICMASTQPPTALPNFEDLSAAEKVRWSLYCFEKMFALELGLSSNLPRSRDYDIPRGFVATAVSNAKSKQGRIFVVMVSLAMTLSEVATRRIRASTREAGSHDPEHDQTHIFLKVQTTGECCMLLSQWANEVPSEYSPSSDLLCDEGSAPFRNLIAMQYNNALLMLTRNSLLISEEAIWHSTEVMAKGQPWEHIIRNGQAITAKAARKILMMAIEGAERLYKPIMPLLSMTLHASFVLYIRGIRHPQALMLTTDRTLIKNAVTQIMALESVANSSNQSLQTAIEIFIATLDQSSDGNTDQRSQMHEGNHASTISTPTLADAILLNSLGSGNNLSILSGTQTGINGTFTIDDADVFSELPDQIGWDWASFSELFPMQETPDGNIDVDVGQYYNGCGGA